MLKVKFFIFEHVKSQNGQHLSKMEIGYLKFLKCWRVHDNLPENRFEDRFLLKVYGSSVWFERK